MAGKGSAGGGDIASFNVEFTSKTIDSFISKLREAETAANGASGALTKLNGTVTIGVNLDEVKKAFQALQLLQQMVDTVNPGLQLTVRVDYKQVEAAKEAVSQLESKVEALDKKMKAIGGVPNTTSAKVSTGEKVRASRKTSAAGNMNQDSSGRGFNTNATFSRYSSNWFARNVIPAEQKNLKGIYKELSPSDYAFLVRAAGYMDESIVSKYLSKAKSFPTLAKFANSKANQEPAHYNPTENILAFNQDHLKELIANKKYIEAGMDSSHELFHNYNRTTGGALYGPYRDAAQSMWAPYYAHALHYDGNPKGDRAQNEQLAMIAELYRNRDTFDQLQWKVQNRSSILGIGGQRAKMSSDGADSATLAFLQAAGVSPYDWGLMVRPSTALAKIAGRDYTPTRGRASAGFDPSWFRMIPDHVAYGTGFQLMQHRLNAAPSRMALGTQFPNRLGLPAWNQLLLGQGNLGANLPQVALHMPQYTGSSARDFVRAMGWAGGKNTLGAAQYGMVYDTATGTLDARREEIALLADGGMKLQKEADAEDAKKQSIEEQNKKLQEQYNQRNKIIRSAYRERDFWYEARSVGLMAAGVTTLPYTAGMALTLDRGAALQGKMQELQARLYDANRANDPGYQLDFQRNMNDLRERALFLGQETVFTAKEIADAEIEFAKQGFSAAEMLQAQADGVDALQAVVTLAAAENLKLGESAYYVATALHGFKMESQDAMQIVNMYAQASNDSALSIADAAHNFAFSAGSVREAWGAMTTDVNGNPLTGDTLMAAEQKNFKAMADTLASWEAAANVGAPRQYLGRYTRGIIDTLSQYENAMQLSAYGVDVQDEEGKLLSLTQIVRNFGNLRKQLESGEVDRYQFNRAMDILPPTYKEYMLQLTDAVYRTREYSKEQGKWVEVTYRGADALDAMSKRNMAARNSTKAWDIAQARMEGFNGAVEKLKGSLDTMFINIANSGVLDFATMLVSALEHVVDFIAKAVAIVPGLGPLLTIFAGLLAVLPLVWLAMSQFFTMQINIRLASALMEQEIAENGGTMVGLGLSTKFACTMLSMLRGEMIGVAAAGTAMNASLMKGGKVVTGSSILSGLQNNKMLKSLGGTLTGVGTSLGARLGIGALMGGGAGGIGAGATALASNPVGWVVAGAILAVAALAVVGAAMWKLAERNEKFAKDSAKMFEDFGKLWTTMSTGFGDILENSMMKPLGDSINTLLDAVGDLIASFLDPLVQAADKFALALDPVVDLMNAAFNSSMVNTMKQITDGIYSMAYAAELLAGDLEGAQEVMDKWKGTDQNYIDQVKKYEEELKQTGKTNEAINGAMVGITGMDGSTPTSPATPEISPQVQGDMQNSEWIRRLFRGAVVGNTVGRLPFPFNLLGSIPMFASGGNVSKPTVAIVGESGNETVVPAEGAPVVNGGFGMNGLQSTTKTGFNEVLRSMSGLTEAVMTLNAALDLIFTIGKSIYAMVYNGLGYVYDALTGFINGVAAMLGQQDKVDLPSWSELFGGWDPSKVFADNSETGEPATAESIGKYLSDLLTGKRDSATGELIGEGEGTGTGTGPAKEEQKPLTWSDWVKEIVWGDYITGPDWMSLISGIAWGMIITSPAWNLIIGTIDWLKLILPPQWSQLIFGVPWLEIITKIPWLDVINPLSWGAFVGSLNWSDFVHGISFGLFASGGVVKKATAGVFGEAGPEAVIPLSKLPQMLPEIVNSVGLPEIAMSTDRTAEYVTAPNRPVNVTVELDGDVLMRKQLPRMSDEIRLQAGL